MDVLKVNKYNLNLLEIFVSNLGDAALSFRYFAKRDISIVLKHEVTLLILLKGQPVAYGHLEKEKEIIWLGLCVLPNYQQLGFGKSMMKLLMQSAIDLDIKNINYDDIIPDKNISFALNTLLLVCGFIMIIS